jgi:hypothetical protein
MDINLIEDKKLAIFQAKKLISVKNKNEKV